MKKFNGKGFNNVLGLCVTAMLAAVSIVSLYVVRFPLIPAASFLEYDMADVPVMIGALLINPFMGMAILLVVCLIQALTVSAASGWIGFVMHLVASGVMVLVSSLIYRFCGKNTKSLVIGLVAGSIAMTVVMIPLNLVFTGIFLGAGVQTVVGMLIPAIIPFNLLKAVINSVLTFIIFLPLKKAFKRIVSE